MKKVLLLIFCMILIVCPLVLGENWVQRKLYDEDGKVIRSYYYDVDAKNSVAEKKVDSINYPSGGGGGGGSVPSLNKDWVEFLETPKPRYVRVPFFGHLAWKVDCSNFEEYYNTIKAQEDDWKTLEAGWIYDACLWEAIGIKFWWANFWLKLTIIILFISVAINLINAFQNRKKRKK